MINAITMYNYIIIILTNKWLLVSVVSNEMYKIRNENVSHIKSSLIDLMSYTYLNLLVFNCGLWWPLYLLLIIML